MASESSGNTVQRHEEILGQIRGLTAGIRDSAAAAEEARTVPRETIDALLSTGITRILVPPRFGGYGLGLDMRKSAGLPQHCYTACCSSALVSRWQSPRRSSPTIPDHLRHLAAMEKSGVLVASGPLEAGQIGLREHDYHPRQGPRRSAPDCRKEPLHKLGPRRFTVEEWQFNQGRTPADRLFESEGRTGRRLRERGWSVPAWSGWAFARARPGRPRGSDEPVITILP